ncbi:MAG: hypothetical protein RLZZ543_351 [Bacteroidota bacterium]|jgi:hypothetical protein
MSKSKRPFSPGFINRFDDKLLKNSPETWSARTHWVLYYALLFFSLVAFFSFIVPDDPRSNSDIASWVVFVILIAIVGLVVWIIYLLRFNVFKRFGYTTPLARLKTWCLYFISVGTIVFITYVPAIVVNLRADLKFSDDEIANDYNAVNTLFCQLAYDSLPHQWTEDTLRVVVPHFNSATEVSSEEAAIIASTEVVMPAYDSIVVEGQTYTIRTIDTSEFASKKTYADSIRYLGDSVWVFAECPGYLAITVPNNLEENTSVHLVTDMELYRNVIKNYAPIEDKSKLINEMQRLRAKYKNDSYYNSYDYAYTMEQTRYKSVYEIYHTSEISSSMDNICDRKHIFNDSDLEWQFRVWFYITFFITLLVFNFRHSTPRAFFLSLLTSILLSILTGLILAFSGGSENSIFSSYFFYFMLFGLMAIGVIQSQTRSVINGIAINIFSWLIYFLPLVITTMYYNGLRNDYNEMNIPYQSFDSDAMERAIFYSEIIGLILFLIAIPTLLHRLYRKWYALPEE